MPYDSSTLMDRPTPCALKLAVATVTPRNLCMIQVKRSHSKVAVRVQKMYTRCRILMVAILMMQMQAVKCGTTKSRAIRHACGILMPSSLGLGQAMNA